MNKSNHPDYYIASPLERGSIISKALTVLVFIGISTGIFIGACSWAKSTARGIEVTVTTENGVIEHD